jgi:hypothetical protein
MPIGQMKLKLEKDKRTRELICCRQHQKVSAFCLTVPIKKRLTLQNFCQLMTLRLKLKLASIHVAIILALWRKIAKDLGFRG